MINKIILLSIFFIGSFAQVIEDEFIWTVQQQNVKRQTGTVAPGTPSSSTLGPTLPDVSIPGLDFLGYGFDLRYERPVDAVRLPMINYNFDKGKTYTYPTYREQRYLVPDEVFIRTVARVDAQNYVSTNTSDLQQTLAVNVGVNYQSLKDARLIQEHTTPNNTIPPSNFSSNFTIPPEAGYFDNMSFKDLPSTQVEGTSKMFALGVEFDFVKRNTKSNLNMYVRNDQLFQLWQMFVDQYKVRDTIQNDIDKLKGKKVESDPVLFGSFFEKYGTHFVFNSIMGGAAQHTALVSRIATVDFTQVKLGVGVQFNTSTFTNSSETQLETFIPNSPNCTGSSLGYSFNTLKKTCQAPIESTCWSPITAANEPFEYGNWNTTAAGFPWRSGPKPWPLRATYLHCDRCSYYYLCSYFWICRAEYSCNCRWLLPTPSVYNGPKTYAGQYNLRTACPDCAKHLFVDGSSQQFSHHRMGIYKYITGAVNPGLIEFHLSNNVNATAVPGGTGPIRWGGHVIFADAPIKDDHDSDRQVAVFGSRINGTSFSLCVLSPAGSGFAAVENRCTTRLFNLNTWHKFSVELNWDGQNMTVWYRPQLSNGDYDATAPIRLFYQIPFFNRQATTIAKIEAYVFQPGMQMMLDQIGFCNAAGGAAYQPVTRDMAVQTSQSLLLQSISGRLDLQWSRTNSKTTFSQTSNFRLKGGDTSKINLLEISKVTDSFQQWKQTLPMNPAPILYTLKEISYLFPNEVFNGVNQRQEMKRAIAMFLIEKEPGNGRSGEQIFNTSPDEKAPEYVNPNDPFTGLPMP